MSKLRSYSELIRIPSYEERLEYLKLHGKVGSDTFGSSRWLNQIFYSSEEWRRLRDDVILRDQGCDVAFPGYEILGNLTVHHINPVTEEMIMDRDPLLMDPDNLVLVSYDTHSLIHYGDSNVLDRIPATRSPNDTCPWKAGR